MVLNESTTIMEWSTADTCEWIFYQGQHLHPQNKYNALKSSPQIEIKQPRSLCTLVNIETDISIYSHITPNCLDGNIKIAILPLIRWFSMSLRPHRGLWHSQLYHHWRIVWIQIQNKNPPSFFGLFGKISLVDDIRRIKSFHSYYFEDDVDQSEPFLGLICSIMD